MKRRKYLNGVRGSVSLLLAMIMLPALTLGGAVVDTARIRAAQSRLDSALNLAGNSLLSCYDRELYERYGLFALPSDYSQASDEVEKTLALTLEGTGENGLPVYYSDVSELPSSRAGRITFATSSVTPASFSSIASPSVLERQILEYMKYRGPLTLGTGLLERFDVLESVSEESGGTAAKLDYDASLGNAEGYARGTYNAFDNYCSQLDSSYFGRYAAAELPALTEKAKNLRAAAEGSAEYADYLGGLKLPGRGFAISDDASFADSSALFISEYNETALVSRLEELKRSEIITDYSKDDADSLCRSFSSVRAFTEALKAAENELKSSYSTALSIYEYVTALKDSAKAEINDRAGYDLCSEAEKKSSKLCSDAGFVIEKGRSLFLFLDKMKPDSKEMADKYTDRHVSQANFLAGILSRALENAGNLAEALEESENKRLLWKNAIEAMPDGPTKDEYRKQYEAGAEFINRDTVLAFAAEIEESLSFFSELAASFPYQDESIRSRSVLCRDREYAGDDVSMLLGRMKELYDVKPEKPDASFVASLKKFALSLLGKKVDDNPAKISEGDIYSCFDSISLLFDSEKEIKASGIDLNFSGETDEEISAGASDSLFSVSDFFSGFADAAASCAEYALEIEYLVNMFSCAADSPDDDTLSGCKMSDSVFFGKEIEYLAFGNDNAALNLLAAGSSIFAIRFALNTVYAMTNAEMRELALVPATAVAGWTGFGIPVVQNVILVCWALAESSVDLIKLEKGDSTAVYKTEDSWFLGFGALKDAVEEGLDAEAATDGFLGKLNSFSYRDYLTVFLMIAFAADRQGVLERCAQLIQINVSASEPGFRISEAATAAWCECGIEVRTCLPVTVGIKNKTVAQKGSFGEYSYEEYGKKFCSY